MIIKIIKGLLLWQELLTFFRIIIHFIRNTIFDTVKTFKLKRKEVVKISSKYP